MIEVIEKIIYSWDCPECGSYNELKKESQKEQEDNDEIECDLCKHKEKWCYHKSMAR